MIRRTVTQGVRACGIMPAAMRRIAVLLLLLTTALPSAAARRRAVRTLPQYPPCGMITGTAAVTFTHNAGATLAPSAENGRPLAYTYGLTTMIDEPDTLLAWHGNDLLTSTDAGCSWRVVASDTEWDFPPRITPARGGRAYIWSDNRRFLMRYDARGLAKLKPPADFVGLGVDANNGDRLRGADNAGAIWESLDAGETWNAIGSLRTNFPLFYRFVFDPNNLDHIVAGVMNEGAHVSRDGGVTWTRSTGLGNSTNVFELVFSPVDSSRVWAEGIDMAQSLRHIWVSSDGGTSFTPVVDESADVTLINGNIMAAHPTNRDVLYFVFGTHFFDYGTDLYRYDLSSRTLIVNHNDHDDFNSIAFSRRDPNLMYLGIEYAD
jgi:hypothetical protein